MWPGFDYFRACLPEGIVRRLKGFSSESSFKFALTLNGQSIKFYPLNKPAKHFMSPYIMLQYTTTKHYSYSSLYKVQKLYHPTKNRGDTTMFASRHILLMNEILSDKVVYERASLEKKANSVTVSSIGVGVCAKVLLG